MKNKNILSLVLVTLFLCLTNLANAQSEIYGTWNVGCAIETYNSSSMGFCALCPRDYKSENSVSIKSFDMVITETTISINDSPAVPYLWDDEINSIKFKFANNEYIFKVMPVNIEIYAWKEINSGYVIILQKK